MLGFTTFNPACVFDLLPPQSSPELPTPGEIQPCFSLPGANIRPYPFWLPGYGQGNSPYLGIGPLGTPLLPPGQLPIDLASQMDPLSAGEIKMLQDAGFDIHDLKGGKNASKKDLFKDKKGNIYVKLKDGRGPGEPTGLNINDYK